LLNLNPYIFWNFETEIFDIIFYSFNILFISISFDYLTVGWLVGLLIRTILSHLHKIRLYRLGSFLVFVFNIDSIFPRSSRNFQKSQFFVCLNSNFETGSVLYLFAANFLLFQKHGGHFNDFACTRRRNRYKSRNCHVKYILHWHFNGNPLKPM